MNYIYQQYGLTVQILKVDGETSLLGDLFENWVLDTGIQVNKSAPNNHDQHGQAERAGGVLTSRARKLRLSSNLPD